jgi:hypothetical protein
MYANVYFGRTIGYAGITFNLIGIIVGVLLIDVIAWVLVKISEKRKDGGNDLFIDVQDTSIEGKPMKEVTFILPEFLKEKMFKGLRESFGIEQESIRMMECDKIKHIKFQFILSQRQADSLGKGLMGMYRVMAGLEKISYN